VCASKDVDRKVNRLVPSGALLFTFHTWNVVKSIKWGPNGSTSYVFLLHETFAPEVDIKLTFLVPRIEIQRIGQKLWFVWSKGSSNIFPIESILKQTEHLETLSNADFYHIFELKELSSDLNEDPIFLFHGCFDFISHCSNVLKFFAWRTNKKRLN
jgi:hypothetical protein